MILLFLAVFVLAGVVVAYNQFFLDKVSEDPKDLFHDALIANLAQDAATCTVDRRDGEETQQLTVQLDLTTKTDARSLLTVKTSDTTVQTEELAVGKDDYLRYTKVSTTATNRQGERPDYSKLINKWIKTDTKKPAELHQLTALGGCVVPLVKLPTLSESSLSREIKSDAVFKADFAKSEKAEMDKRIVRKYPVTIPAEAYVKYMRAVGQAAGLPMLDSLKVADFSDKQARKAVFSVDTKTGRLVHIQFTDEIRSVKFDSYDAIPELKAPAKSITNDEARKLLGQ